MSSYSPPTTPPAEGRERIPAELRMRLIAHGEQTPLHRRIQDRMRKEEDMAYADILTWDDLREVMPYFDDEDLRDIDPMDLVPDCYDEDELVYSRSSGTTGDVKEIYWHEDDVEDNTDYVASYLAEASVPEGGHWVATTTPNPVLRRTLEGLAERFGASYDVVEVDPKPVKRALRSGDPERIRDAFDAVAEEVVPLLEENDVTVYEDIAPMMQAVGRQLDAETRDSIDTLLIGGVGTDAETVEALTGEVFPEATLTGWYGDYMTGSNMMRAPVTGEDTPKMEYVPHRDIDLDVRDTDTYREPVGAEEEGAVIMTAIRRGFFLPNRVVGDIATRRVWGNTEGVADVGRLED